MANKLSHKYNDYADAEHDLNLISGLYCNEDKPVYLHNLGEHYEISNDLRAQFVTAIAINGTVFTAN